MQRLPLLAVSGLLLNALVWGTSWWPFRQLQANGLHSLWATAFIFLIACVLIACTFPGAFRQLRERPNLWLIVLAAGLTNATFNWAVTIGDVVRVVLLFYLMPIWVVLLAHWLLAERIRPLALLHVALALAGAMLVLSKEGMGLPLPSGLPDYLAIIGGATFALNNVLLRKYAHDPAPAKALAMFGGGVLIAAALAIGLTAAGSIEPPTQATPYAWAGASWLAIWFIAGNLALQYGAARLSANLTAVIMLSEILFASVSAVLLAGETLGVRTLCGGALIISAAALAAFTEKEKV